MLVNNDKVKGKRSRLGWVLWPIILGVTVLVLVSVWAGGPKQLVRHVVMALLQDTEYASGFSEAAFLSIQLGDAEASVTSALGAPLRVDRATAHTRWLYTAKPDSDFASSGEVKGSVTNTVLSFDKDGYFQGADGEISNGTNTVGLITTTSGTIGDGQNFLGLTNAEIVKLRDASATEADLRVRFGAPRETFTSQVTRWLCYSRSPGGTHYYIRMIGLDATGSVSRKRSERYWD